jgi:hypothetical protein
MMSRSRLAGVIIAASAGILAISSIASGAAPEPQAASAASQSITVSQVMPKIAAAIEPGAIAFPPEITITGQGFRPGAQVKIGSQAVGVLSVAPTEIHATAGGQAAGIVDVTVTNPDGSSATQSKSFTYTTGPFIYAISPQMGDAAMPTLVQITGGNFANDSEITFGELAAPIQFLFSSASVQVQVPANSATSREKTSVAVAVKNSDGQTFTLPGAFTWIASGPVPSITPEPTSKTSVDPDSCGF